ncbi:MAG: hypothetical protein AB1733_19015 [Thermodesulfobacteriota bacterium]
MKRLVLAALLCFGFLASHASVSAWQSNSIKVNPHGVDYPLIRPVPYPATDTDPYERSFGIRRWLNFAGSEIDDYKKTYAESQKWFDLYGGYGVLGHGEEVFTNAAAAWRRYHRGR